jgi:hypothetical protein
MENCHRYIRYGNLYNFVDLMFQKIIYIYFLKTFYNLNYRHKMMFINYFSRYYTFINRIYIIFILLWDC